MPTHGSRSMIARWAPVAIVMLCLTALLSGCGPSRELESARAELASAQTGLAQATTELATVQVKAQEGEAALATTEAVARNQDERNRELVNTLATAEAEARAQQSELDATKKELSTAQAQLDELKFGAERLLSQAEAAVKDGSLAAAKNKAQTLLDKYPDAKEAERAKEIVALAEKDAADKQAAEEARLAAAASKMRTETDDVRGITFYMDQNTTPYDNVDSLHLYIGKKGKSLWLRMRIQWEGSDWLFIERYTVKVDSKTFSIPLSYSDIKRDNSGGRVWEWYDGTMTAQDVEMIQRIIASDNTIVRCEGETYHDDRTVTAAEKRSLQNVLDAFVAMGGKLSAPGGV